MLDAAASLGAKAVPNMMRGLEHPEVRRYAVGVLGRIGPDAAEAVPKLLELLDGADAQLRNEILFTLGSIGPAAKAGVPAAIAGLQDEDEEVRFSAVYALGKIGPEAAEALASLERALGSEDPKFCTACAWALVRVDPENEENAQKALPLLIEALDSSTPFVRVEAAGTLGLLGPKAKDALPKLKQMAEGDKSDTVREAAAEAVKLIEGTA
jgi:HEAT repeat protein